MLRIKKDLPFKFFGWKSTKYYLNSWVGIEVIVRPLYKEQEEHAEKSIAGIKRRKKF